MTRHPCTRTDKAVRWVVFHAGELLGIAVPLLLAVVVAAWFGALAVMTGAWWVTHEVRDQRRQREIRELRAAADRRWLLNIEDTTTSVTEERSPQEGQL